MLYRHLLRQFPGYKLSELRAESAELIGMAGLI